MTADIIVGVLQSSVIAIVLFAIVLFAVKRVIQQVSIQWKNHESSDSGGVTMNIS